MVTNLCPAQGNEEWCGGGAEGNKYGFEAHFDIMSQALPAGGWGELIPFLLTTLPFLSLSLSLSRILPPLFRRFFIDYGRGCEEADQGLLCVDNPVVQYRKVECPAEMASNFQTCEAAGGKARVRRGVRGAA